MGRLQPCWPLTSSRMDCAPASRSRRATCSPRAAACSGVAVARWRTYCAPSTEQTKASRTNSPRSVRAQAPRGTWQPPCSAESRARSAMMAEAAGADARAMAQIGQRGPAGGDEAISDVFAAENGRKGQARVDFGGNVLDAVNGNVDRFIHQGVFEFLDENAFAADLGERGVGELIAGSLDDDDFSFDTGGGKEALANVFGLPFGKKAAAPANAQGPHGFSTFEMARA